MFVRDCGDFALKLGKDRSEASPRALVVLVEEGGIPHLVDAARSITMVEIACVL